MKLRFLLFTFAFFLAFNNQSFSAPFAGELDRSFNPTVGRIDTVRVRAIVAQPDGKFIIAGSLLKINGLQVNSVARFNADGSLDQTFDAAGTIFGQVSILALQPDGKIIVGGSFDSVARQTRRRLARLNADGSFDPTFAPPVQNFANSPAAIAVQSDGKVLVYGASLFPGRDFARLNADGSIDTSFPVINVGPTSIVAQPDGKILITGGSLVINGQTRNGIARLNSDGTLDTTFVNQNIGGTTVFRAALAPNGKIMIGGLFNTIGGQQFQRLARLNADGSSDPTFANNPNRVVSVREIAVQSDGKVVYSGLDTPIYRDNADGMPDAGFATRSRIIDEVDLVAALPDDRIVVGGRMNIYNSTPPSPNDTRAQPMALLAADGTIDDAVNHDIAYSEGLSVVDILVEPNGKILFAEDYEQIMRFPFRHIVRFNPNGSVDPTFSFPTVPTNIINTTAAVSQIARQSDGKIIFGTINNNASNRNVFRLNADGSFDAGFNVNYSGNSGDIYKIEVLPDDDILITGNFTQINGQPRANFARLNADGSLDSFNPTMTVQGGGTPAITGFVLQPDGKFYLSGGFNTINGHATTNIARFNTNGAVDTSFTNGFTGVSNQFLLLAAQPDGKLIYAAFGGVARLNANGSVDQSFTTVGFRAGQNTSTPIQAAVLPNGKILIGGSFTSTADFSVQRTGFARLNADGTLDAAYGANGGTSGSNNVVYKIEIQPDGKALIGGRFAYVNNISQFTFARLNTTANASGNAPNDFDGDGKADVSVFRPSNGTWYLQNSTSGFSGAQFGASTDRIVPADYDGDGKTDLAVFRAGVWYLNRSTAGFTGINFGASEDIPVPADYDGDGRADIAVFRPSNGTWYLQRSAQGFTGIAFGQAGDKPVAADYDGDGRADLAVFRAGVWYIQRSQSGFVGVSFGAAEDRLTPADYDGDGKADVAVFRPSTGTWYVQRSQAGFVGILFGQSGDVPTPGDYDGDGRADIAVFRSGAWYLNRSTAGFTGVSFGAASDTPVPAALVR